MADVSMRQLGKMVRKLHLSDGDILMVKQGSGIDDMKTLETLADQIGLTLGIANCIMLVMRDLDDLAKLDHATMYKHGWVQIDHLAELFSRKRGIPRSTTKAEIVEAMDNASEDDTASKPVQG